MRCLAVLLFALLPACQAHAADAATAPHFMVSSANPHATEAGRAILARGGSAVDAAIAVQAVLGLVEPQSSGIGGGGFLLHFDPELDLLESYDGRETAPADLDPTLFLDEEGNRLGFIQAALGGAAVGTPGVMKMLELAHQEHGVLPWSDLFGAAETLAREGFAMSPRMHQVAASSARRFKALDFDIQTLGPIADYLFTADGDAKPAGTVMKNPAYARTMRALAKDGTDIFYKGYVAEAMVKAVQQANIRPGALSLEDLAAYRPKKRTPVCSRYRSKEICSMGPPSSGATTMLAMLGILEGFDMTAAGPMSEQAIHYYSEASRLAYADRNRFIADPDFAPVPAKGMIDKEYLAMRRALIQEDKALDEVKAGPVPRETASIFGDHLGHDYPATSHMSVVDASGRVVSFTTTVQIAFGSYVMAEGFILNNQLTDFSFLLEDEEGRPIANRPAPLKRPRSSMTPTIAFDDQGRFDFAIGSPGGGNIISYVTKTVMGLVDWNLGMQEAINLPNLVNRGSALWLEKDTELDNLTDAMTLRGNQVRMRGMTSGLHGIRAVRRPDGTFSHYEGGADPRREGTAAGG